jgi:cellulose synthase/poly-beta-1,6-N-acetylglucosamine synthase-like glycosyltransferase
MSVYNERYVIRRLVAACAAMAEAYGKDNASILLLDDSDDDTIQEVDQVVREYREKHFRMEVLRRDSRDGFKAGALQAALNRTDEEFIAIFDADFIPPADFLSRTLPHFDQNECLGIVQGRWTHLNQDSSLVTRAISHIIDVHFLIDQPGRYSAGIFQNFNGSGGVLRKKAILDAGGWQTDTLAEDLDLSYRMQMLGYRILYLKDILCPGEIPPTIPNFKQQQGRWAHGTMKTAMKILPGLLQNPKFGLKLRLQAFLHLTGYMIQPLMVVSFLLSCLASFFGLGYFSDRRCIFPDHGSRSHFYDENCHHYFLQNLAWFFLAALISLCTLAPWISLVSTLKAQKHSVARNLASLFVLLLLCFGISLSTMRGVGRALFTKRAQEWNSDPKHAGLQNIQDWRESKYQIPLDTLWVWELVFVIAGLGAVGNAFQHTNFTVLVILVPFTLSYGYVLLFSLLESRKALG